MDFHVVNRATSILDSTFLGIWMDADIGCYTDDYFGSYPAKHAFMVFNADSLDGTVGNACDQGVQSYVIGPPVLSGSFLNTSMSSFMYYINGSVGSLPPGMTEPRAGAPIECYRLLTGTWIDGTPLTIGGTGYNHMGGLVQTDFAFPGDPNDPISWSMTNENPAAGNRRFVASTDIGRLDPGGVAAFSMAFTLHLDPDKDNLENVTLMYEQLPELKNKWSQRLPECVQRSYCTEDCVWPGDANNDGIANHEDVLSLGLAHGQQGETRFGVPNWTPQTGESWNGTFLSGLNMKHADANGDGVIGIDSDGEVLDLHYGFTHDDYVSTSECMDGDALIIDGGFEVHNPSIFASITRIHLNPDVVPELHGLAFTVLYDTTFFGFTSWLNPSDPFEDPTGYLLCVGRTGYLGQESLPYGRIEYAVTRTDLQNQSFSEQTELLSLMFYYKREDLIPGQPDTTFVCLANIRGVLADGTEIPMGSNRAMYIFKEHPTSVEEPHDARVQIYPNPSTGEINIIAADDLSGSEYTIYDPSGAVLRTGIMRSERLTTLLPAGVFTLVVNHSEVSIVKRIVVIYP
jgi:hypothetical protein